MSLDEFASIRRERKLTLLHGSRTADFRTIAGWQAIRGLLESGNHPKQDGDIRVTRGSVPAPRDRWTADGKIDLPKLDAYLARGFSVTLTRIEPHVPALQALCEDIRARNYDGSFVGLIVTTGAGQGAFKIHYDPEDLLIVQIEGTKRWQFFGTAVPIPVRSMPKQTPPSESDLVFDEVLEAGDLLYVPGGYWHRCENGLSTSVHMGVFFIPPTPWHVFSDCLRSLLADDKYRSPLTTAVGVYDVSALEAELKSSLIDRITALDFAEFVKRWSKIAY
jgi:ribosomal protein L16 Arg81 hydroxylase